MGQPKLALPLANSTVLGCVVAALRQGGVDEVLVVVGPHVPELHAIARAAGAESLLLERETPDMRATVEQGLRWLQEQRRPEPADAWLLCPADHPALQLDVVRSLLQARRDAPDRTIVIPTYQGKRGHPALIGWEHVAGLRNLPPEHGLNIYLRAHLDETLLLPLDSEPVLWDLDTPEDYERLVRLIGAKS
jgi:molybdenum cofactor cytidylyltransferase